jgi:hypothetical protein
MGKPSLQSKLRWPFPHRRERACSLLDLGFLVLPYYRELNRTGPSGCFPVPCISEVSCLRPFYFLPNPEGL